MIPETIGRYRIEGLLGQGAMGVVYRGHDPEIDRPVAVKLIRADLLRGEEREEYLRRFRREAQAAGRCTHANIVALHDVGQDAAGNPFLVMEYVDGTGLDRQLARGMRWTPAEIAAIGAQILDALDCAHGLGVVHRDIKPANILLPGQGLRVKVTDFGISRLVSSDMTQVGSVIGTPSYMSPEQCQGETAGPPSDLFSVASVLYEMASGRRAFTGGTIGRLALQLARETPPPIAGLPPALQAVIDRAHAKQPAARFASARAMAAALRAAAAANGMAPHGMAPHGMAPLGTAPLGTASDGTVVLAPPSGITPESPALRAIEAALGRAIGPIARHLVQRARAQAGSLAEMLPALAERIEDAAQRRDFLRAAEAALGLGVTDSLSSGAGSGVAGRSGTQAGGVAPEVYAPLVRSLSRYLGPIAAVLVRRAAARAATLDQLREEVAQHIPDDRERAAFLSGA